MRRLWLWGLCDVFRHLPPSPRAQPLIDPAPRKKATKRTRRSTIGDLYIVGADNGKQWSPEWRTVSMPFHPQVALMFLPGDVYDGHQEQDNPASVPLLTSHVGDGVSTMALWVAHGAQHFVEHVVQYGAEQSGQ